MSNILVQNNHKEISSVSLILKQDLIFFNAFIYLKLSIRILKYFTKEKSKMPTSGSVMIDSLSLNIHINNIRAHLGDVKFTIIVLALNVGFFL